MQLEPLYKRPMYNAFPEYVPVSEKKLYNRQIKRKIILLHL